MACVSILFSVIVIVLNVGNVLAALVLDAIDHVGVQLGANDNPLRQVLIPSS